MVLCPSCDAILPAWLMKTGQRDMLCPACFKDISIDIFPALFRKPGNIEPEKLRLVEGQSCCYEHSTKPAVEACQRCGRFVCALCEVEMQGQVLCPSCFENSRSEQAASGLQTNRVLYDSIALAIATWPLLTVYFSILSSPIAIYVALRYWKRPSSIIPRTKWRSVVALVLGAAELGMLGLIVFAIILQLRLLRAR